ncbi:RraA family protein [Deinococcus metallilatus]|uniref:4-hydroxy-4-methyl-2-oxoglutarate aldolase n=1 Tax=Deinococcus metallilatus TaxID=1211322 RepID=A0AAJ5F653_9DEIO|nr:ribonuclease E activity regulator RraA [Deinococcus metallilatus]MBB5296988.1 regulator of ribonuclease activity A [Deinococcus metallilatus]QBY07874.1 RraA family protein [Deinococcus metallilatus]RXJ13223.1 RraA family protein [Deinococcus metallilatus]TLK23004.1 RraA family protein [Deinococcus metallilatus]GMA15954.1 putative 4-hydroxy-4-methyl-2-oxoglutarate aldolase [Deinococcus metallilatus]
MTDFPPGFTPTTDLSDAHPGAPVLAPIFRDYGGRPRFYGPAVTVRVQDDNVLVRAALEEPGQGRVLVVDNGGSLNCAVLGGMLGLIGVQNGWAGVIVNGCVRDTGELATLPLGIKALAAHPRRSAKRGQGERDVPVAFAGVTLHPGDPVYADEDGVVCLPGRDK